MGLDKIAGGRLESFFSPPSYKFVKELFNPREL